MNYGAYDGCRIAVDSFLSSRGLKKYLYPIDDEVRVFQK